MLADAAADYLALLEVAGAALGWLLGVLLLVWIVRAWVAVADYRLRKRVSKRGSIGLVRLERWK